MTATVLLYFFMFHQGQFYQVDWSTCFYLLFYYLLLLFDFRQHVIYILLCFFNYYFNNEIHVLTVHL